MLSSDSPSCPYIVLTLLGRASTDKATQEARLSHWQHVHSPQVKKVIQQGISAGLDEPLKSCAWDRYLQEFDHLQKHMTTGSGFGRLPA